MSQSIKSLDLDELTSLIIEIDHPKYRAKQVYEWLHTHNVSSYDDMTNVPKSLRQALADKFPIASSKVIKKLESSDGSRKYLIELSDGNVIEAVGIVDDNKGIDSSDDDVSDIRLTVCASSQVGCAMGCRFCATGTEGFTRNLTADEIVDQVVHIGNDFESRVDNVVIMGQGEPFQNYDNVVEAIRRMNSDKGLNIGTRHITVSTSGITDGIYKFADEPEQFRLAISLHSADQPTRNELMPRLSGQPLRKLKKSLEYYSDVKGRRITIEYLLIDGVNDSDKQLKQLIEFCDDINAHVNLLQFNPIDGSEYKTSKQSVIGKWHKRLQESGIQSSIRHSKGQDISGACGQLKGNRN